MNKGETETLCKIAGLMSACPKASPNPYDMVGYIHASRDFAKIVRLASTALSSYANFRYLSAQTDALKHGEIDREAVEEYMHMYKESLDELEVFVLKRRAENWD